MRGEPGQVSWAETGSGRGIQAMTQWETELVTVSELGSRHPPDMRRAETCPWSLLTS